MADYVFLEEIALAVEGAICLARDGTNAEIAEAVLAVLSPEVGRLVEALTKHTEFWEELSAMFYSAGPGDIDGGDFQDLASRHGLIERVPFDPAKHDGDGIAEPGDDWYVPTNIGRAALATAGQQQEDKTCA